MNHALASAIYFVVQRLRRGVLPAEIEDARRLLVSGLRATIHNRDRRLSEMYDIRGSVESWIASQPSTDRHQLRTKMLDAALTSSPWSVQHRRTSGSSGAPFSFVKSREMTRLMDAAMWAAYAWHGITPGLRQARFWGVPSSRSAQVSTVIADFLFNRRRFSAFSSNDGTARAYFETLARFRPYYAYGYPTLIDDFVGRCSSLGLCGRSLGIRVVITTGELLTDSTRTRLADFFGCPVRNEYGCTESGIISFECTHGTPHIVPIAIWPEVISEVSGDAVATGQGEVLISDLAGSVEPLLRYRLYDSVQLSHADCRCGSDLPSLRVDRGRIGAFILTPSRGKQFATVLAYEVPSSVTRFRARQVRHDLIEADIVLAKGIDVESAVAECTSSWQRKLGSDMRISVRVVTDLPLSANGKLRYFVPLGE